MHDCRRPRTDSPGRRPPLCAPTKLPFCEAAGRSSARARCSAGWPGGLRNACRATPGRPGYCARNACRGSDAGRCGRAGATLLAVGGWRSPTLQPAVGGGPWCGALLGRRDQDPVERHRAEWTRGRLPAFRNPYASVPGETTVEFPDGSVRSRCQPTPRALRVGSGTHPDSRTLTAPTGTTPTDSRHPIDSMQAPARFALPRSVHMDATAAKRAPPLCSRSSKSCRHDAPA
jgi:hypothetical protein